MRESKDLNRFWKRLAIFLLLVVILLGFALLCLNRSGELRPFSSYLHKLNKGQLFGLAYTNHDQRYKFHMTDKVFSPQVLALGSSRIMEIRSSLIKPDYTFYNAGGAIQNIYELPLFVKKLQNNPDFILLNIDQWWFNPAFEVERDNFSSFVYDEPIISYRKVGRMICKFYGDLALGKISLQKMVTSDDIGLNAVCNRNGFDAEGVRIQEQIVNNPQKAEDYNFQDVMKRIREGNRRFQYGSVADTTIIDAIDDFLKLCVERNITVVAFLPPFAPLVYEFMQDTGKYDYMSQIYAILVPVFAKYNGCSLYDFTDVSSLGVKNCDFVDGFHGSELVYNRMIKEILEKETRMKDYFVDIKSIDDLDSVYIAKKIRYHSVD